NWLGATSDDDALTGAMIPRQDWYAPGLGTAEGNGLAGRSKQDIADFLHTGRSSRSISDGTMAEGVHASLQHLTRADVEAMATYLTERPPAATPLDQGGFLPPSMRRRSVAHLNRWMVQGHAIYRKH